MNVVCTFFSPSKLYNQEVIKHKITPDLNVKCASCPTDKSSFNYIGGDRSSLAESYMCTIHTNTIFNLYMQTAENGLLDKVSKT